jgi:hypothetical protein
MGKPDDISKSIVKKPPKPEKINFRIVVQCIVFYVCIQTSNKIQQYLGFIARSLYMFRALSAPIIRSTITAVDSHWYNISYAGS